MDIFLKFIRLPYELAGVYIFYNKKLGGRQLPQQGQVQCLYSSLGFASS